MKYFLLILFILPSWKNLIAEINLRVELFQNNTSEILDTIKTKTPFKKDSLSTSFTDTTKIIQKEKLLPINLPSSINYDSTGFTLQKEKLNYTDYRTTADYFRQSTFGFIRDLGIVGQPNEVMLYGQGFNNISFINNGIEINNRIQNSFDVNLFQSESIDSIEVFPLAQGFLYSNINNVSLINFISKDFNTKQPYSRIKFYQAPFEEGMFDGIFSSNFGPRLSTFFEITNQSTDLRYSNTDYSFWSGLIRLRYLLNENINLNFSYNYSQTNQQLYGGVDADNINNLYPPEQFTEVLFSADAAPVRFADRYQKVRNHFFVFDLTAKISHNDLLNFSLYSIAGLTEFRQNEYNRTSPNNIAVIANNNRYETYGAKLFYKHNFSIINYSSTNLIEEIKLSSYGNFIRRDLTNFSSAHKFLFFPNSNFISVSVFGKYLNYDGENNSGYGFDGTFDISKQIKLYGGYSNFDKPRSILENIPYQIISDDILTDSPSLGKSKNTNIELKLIYSSNALNLSLGFFSQNQKDKLISGIVYEDSSKKDQAVYFRREDGFIKGFNLNIDFTIWKLLFRSNTSYYFDSKSRSELGIPEFTSNGGIYYIDTLFNHNLKLKTGINYYSIGSRNQIYFDFEKGISTPYIIDNYYNGSVINSFEYFSPEFQFDFFFSGKIQDRAIIYFVFENLLNCQYFIVPYFPKQERGIRFGVAWEFLD